MNTYNFTDTAFQKTDIYKQFINNNPTNGYLKIRAYTASEAIPISGLDITISKQINSSNIIFYKGTTNSSGIIERITLPTPKLNQDNLDTPSNITYDVTATYPKENYQETFKVNMYENIYVIQTINIVPTLNVLSGGN